MELHGQQNDARRRRKVCSIFVEHVVCVFFGWFSIDTVQCIACVVVMGNWDVMATKTCRFGSDNSSDQVNPAFAELTSPMVCCTEGE